MDFAIDLNPRQSARILEQAMRHRAEVILEPRVWPEDRTIPCRLEPPPDGNDPHLRYHPLILIPALTESAANEGEQTSVHSLSPKENMPDWQELVGTYCDASINLSEHRYLFEADVIWVEYVSEPSAGCRIYVSCPQCLQVAQRRRYRRITLAQSTQVELHWGDTEKPAFRSLGWLCNLSADGLACRTDRRTADDVWIGDRVEVCFTLGSSDPQRFQIDAVLCNKTPAGTTDKFILGLQFLTDEEHPDSAAAIKVLRKRLMKTCSLPARSRGGSER